MSPALSLGVPESDLADFCRRWRIVELAVFGSVLRPDFGPNSDIDLLATFAPSAQWSLFDHMQMELELVDVLKREVDLVDRRAVEKNARPRSRHEVLDKARIIYSAPEADQVAG